MTYRWEPATPLDRILAIGFKRMDEAVDGVIAEHEIVIAGERFERDFAEALACDTDMPDKVNRAICNLLNIRNWSAREQHIESYENSLRQGRGLHSIGDQSAFGSPLYQLGAAYRNAFGGGI